MKKLVTLISTLNLSISSIIPITSCSTDASKDKKEDESNNTDDTSNNEVVPTNDEAKIEVQELNIVSMLDEGIDAEGLLTTNSTVAEAVELVNEKAQNINENIIISSQNDTTDHEKKLTAGINKIKVVIKNTNNKKDEQKTTAIIKNVQEVKTDSAHFSGVLDGLFNKPLDGKQYSVLNTYDDVLALIEEQIIQVENKINIKLVNEDKKDTKLVSTENKINIRFSDDKNSVDKEVKIINVQKENVFVRIKEEIKNGAIKINSLGHSIVERTKNTASRIWNSIKSVGGKIKVNVASLETKIANALKGKNQKVEVEVEIDGTSQNVTISIDEDKEGANEITKKLILNMLDNFALNTESLTTNDKLGSIIPIVQSHISGVKSAHEYSIFIKPKDKIKKFKASNRIALTFKKWKESNISFSHTINVAINKKSSKLNLDFLPKHIDASKFGFTTETKWSSILKYVQVSLDSFTAKNYTIKIVDKKSSQKLKATDHQFSVLITSKKSKADKTNFKITISNIKTGVKKGTKEKLKGFWDKVTGKNKSTNKKPVKKPSKSKNKK